MLTLGVQIIHQPAQTFYLRGQHVAVLLAHRMTSRYRALNALYIGHVTVQRGQLLPTD